jgi:hypothetical protein
MTCAPGGTGTALGWRKTMSASRERFTGGVWIRTAVSHFDEQMDS